MYLTTLLTLTAFYAQILGTYGKCPEEFDIEVNRQCYRFEKSPMKFEDAKQNCKDQAKNSRLTTVREFELIYWILAGRVIKFINKKIETSVIWTGMYMNDKNEKMPKKYRTWKWAYNDTEFKQKDYKYWTEKGGPTSQHNCAVINASASFRVQAEKCDGNVQYPAMCIMTDNKPCSSDLLPYLTYGSYCLGMIHQNVTYHESTTACDTEKVAPFLEKMREDVIWAIKNSFLGGAMFLNIEKEEGKFIDRETNMEVDKKMWEDGEPRRDYKCVGLALQKDDSLKLKTINCAFLATSLCILGANVLLLPNVCVN